MESRLGVGSIGSRYYMNNSNEAINKYDGLTSFSSMHTNAGFTDGYIIAGTNIPFNTHDPTLNNKEWPGKVEWRNLYGSYTPQALSITLKFDWALFSRADANNYFIIWRFTRGSDIPAKKSVWWADYNHRKYDPSWNRVPVRNVGSAGNDPTNQTSEAQKLSQQVVKCYTTWADLYDHVDDNEFLDSRTDNDSSLTGVMTKPIFFEWDVISINHLENWQADAGHTHVVTADVHMYVKLDRLTVFHDEGIFDE